MTHSSTRRALTEVLISRPDRQSVQFDETNLSPFVSVFVGLFYKEKIRSLSNTF